MRSCSIGSAQLTPKYVYPVLFQFWDWASGSLSFPTPTFWKAEELTNFWVGVSFVAHHINSNKDKNKYKDILQDMDKHRQRQKLCMYRSRSNLSATLCELASDAARSFNYIPLWTFRPGRVKSLFPRHYNSIYVCAVLGGEVGGGLNGWAAVREWKPRRDFFNCPQT